MYTLIPATTPRLYSQFTPRRDQCCFYAVSQNLLSSRQQRQQQQPSSSFSSQNGWTDVISSLQPQRRYSNGPPAGRPTSSGGGAAELPDEDSDLLSRVGQTALFSNRDFLLTIQRELEQQRTSWKPEVDRLTYGGAATLDGEDGGVDGGNGYDDGDGGGRSSRSARVRTSSNNNSASGSSDAMDSPFAGAEANSYVDTSGIRPTFKAFVDVSDYSPHDVQVSVYCGVALAQLWLCYSSQPGRPAIRGYT